MSTADNPSNRPTRLCPDCRSIQAKNFDRHLNHHYDITTSIGRKLKLRVKREAMRRTEQGLREAEPQLLPKVFKDAMAKDTQVAHAFQQFLDDVGVIWPKQDEDQKQTDSRLPPPRPAMKRKSDDDMSDSEVGIKIILSPLPSLQFLFINFKKLTKNMDYSVLKGAVPFYFKEHQTKTERTGIPTSG